MRLFDQRFGVDFLAEVPTQPGVYRLYDEAGTLLYVGKAANLRRRLGQYRTAGRKKRERKRRALVKAATSITWEVCESALAATLAEIRLIQTLRPPRNVTSAFPRPGTSSTRSRWHSFTARASSAASPASRVNDRGKEQVALLLGNRIA